MFQNPNVNFQSQENQRLWGPILVGAALVSAPFWIGLNKNNNNNNCCYQPYYQPYYPQPYQPNYQQPYQPNYQYPSYIENNNYYI